MDGPNEIYTIPFTSVNKFFDVLLFAFGIRQTPVGRTVIRVVLRTVDIDVELVPAVEVNQ